LKSAIETFTTPLPISEENMQAIALSGQIPVEKVRLIVRLTVMAMQGLLLEPEREL
jgi:hypothetical protein